MTPKKYFDKNPYPEIPGYVFVILPEESTNIYNEYIKNTVESLELKCESYLDFKKPDNMIENILNRIQSAEIIIADITDFNPNVMLELGVALTIKDESKILIIREKQKVKNQVELSFNIYYHRISCYYDRKKMDDFRDQLTRVLSGIERYFERPLILSLEVKKLLESTLNLIERKDWLSADILFETMNQREPNNWYIFNQWGIMFRLRNDFQKSFEKFNEAIEYARSANDRVYIYIELAKLFQTKRQYNQAEEYFKKAELEDNKNRYLYIAFATFYDELHDFYRAQMKIGQYLQGLSVDDPLYNEFKIRFDYYTHKINDRKYIKTLDDYLQEQQKVKHKMSDTNSVSQKSSDQLQNLTSPSVFISYAKEDIAYAKKLYENLFQTGANVWIDYESLLPGQKWRPAIRQAIRESRFFISLLSSNSVNKIGYVQKEMKEALEILSEYLESQIYLIPIRLDDCNVADEILKEIHHVDMFPSWENGLDQIIRALQSQEK